MQLEEAIEHLGAETSQQRFRLDSAWSEKLARNAVDITDRFNAALMAADARTDAARTEAAGLAARLENLSELSARVTELEQLNAQLLAGSATVAEKENDTAALRLEIAEIEAGAARLAESHAADLRRAEEEWSEKFARSAMEITQRFQSELATAVDHLNLLHSDNEAAAARIRELEIENLDIRAAAEANQATVENEWNEKLQTIVQHLASDHEADIGQAMLEKEEARAEARRLAKRLSQLEASGREIASAFEDIQKRNEALRVETEQLRSRADSRDSEWSARLAANALELTQRFNGTMAAAETRLQDARREAQTLTSRIHELEQINAALRVSDQERRAAIDAEWSEKLETIVNHLASDHETDLGQTIVEREAARAETRHSNDRLAALQKSTADERAAFEESHAQWTRERDELTRSVELLRRRLGLGTQSGGTPVPAPTEHGDRNPTVLVVHRDSAVRAIAKHALESSGYDVTTASDGLEAFRVATSQKPDVVLAESTMPKMDGRELVQMLKSRPETAAVKIVLMAGAGNEGGSYASSDFHADDFLRDPANIEALKTTLANVLAARV
jgi:CheY-like chemotaxis protein